MAKQIQMWESSRGGVFRTPEEADRDTEFAALVEEYLDKDLWLDSGIGPAIKFEELLDWFKENKDFASRVLSYLATAAAVEDDQNA